MNILKTLSAMALAGIVLCGCDSMNDINKKWYDQGEKTYTGMVENISLTAGYERVVMNWELGADPRITQVVISWNEGRDSVEVPVVRTGAAPLAMSHTIENLEEDNYIFVFCTKDAAGNRSVPQEEAVTVFGRNYASNLRPRGISSFSKRADGYVEIRWSDVSSTAVQYSTLRWTAADGSQMERKVGNAESLTLLAGLEKGMTVKASSVYLPEGSLDEMESQVREYTVPGLVAEMDKKLFAAVVCAGDNNTNAGGRDLSRIWDGKTPNPNILHTLANAAGFSFPHYFTWDIGRVCGLTMFHIWPRTDSSKSYYDHQPRIFELWVTDELKADTGDESYWKTDAWKADWTKVIDETGIPTATADALATWQAGWEYEIAGEVPARYFRLVAKANWGGENVVNIGEVSIWGNI